MHMHEGWNTQIEKVFLLLITMYMYKQKWVPNVKAKNIETTIYET